MWIDTDRGSRIAAFHIRRGHEITLLVSHANAEDLGLVLAYWSTMAQTLGVDVLSYDYSGYGHSSGKPSEDNMYADARAAFKLLVEGFGLKPELNIVLYGKSIGSCPTAYLASQHRVRGVVIVSGLASGARVLFPTWKTYLADAVAFNNIGRLSSNKSPVQIIHGTHDETVSFSNGSDLHAACNKHHPLPPAWIDGATHNNLELVHSGDYLRALRAFFDHLLVNPPSLKPQKREGWLDWIIGFSSCGEGQQSASDKVLAAKGSAAAAPRKAGAAVPGAGLPAAEGSAPKS